MGHSVVRTIVTAVILLSMSGCGGEALRRSDGLPGSLAPDQAQSVIEDWWPGKVEIGTVEAAGVLAESWNPFFGESRTLADLLEQSLRREGLLALEGEPDASVLDVTLTDLKVILFSGGWLDTTMQSTVIYQLSPSTANGNPHTVELVAEYTYSAPLGAANRVQRADRAVIGSLAENVRLFVEHLGRSDEDV